MDATTALAFLTRQAQDVIDRDRAARKRLTEALAIDASKAESLMDSVLTTTGEALPWMHLLRRIDRHGVREGLAKQRHEASDNLLRWGFGMSTSMVTNAARLAEQDGLRRFLSATDGFTIDEDQAEAPAPAATREPAPALAVSEAPKATPAQRRTLAAIRDNGVRIQEFRVATTRVEVERGERPRKDMVEFVIQQGWATQDTACSLFHGQPVTLTAIGTAILAG